MLQYAEVIIKEYFDYVLKEGAPNRSEMKL